jgi:hypothetical protein
MRALRPFTEAGLTDARAQTFVGEARAPLNTECRRSLTSLFEMLWGAASPEAVEAAGWVPALVPGRLT